MAEREGYFGGKETSTASEGFCKSADVAAGPSSDSRNSTDVTENDSCNGDRELIAETSENGNGTSRDVTGNSGCNGVAETNNGTSRDVTGCNGVAGTKWTVYHWHDGVEFWLPSALRLAPGCTLDDDVLQFVGSFSLLDKAVAALEKTRLPLAFDVVDGSLWVTMPSTVFSDLVSEQVGHQLRLWRNRAGIHEPYYVSGSSALIYRSHQRKMIIADAYVFKQDNLLRAREICEMRHKIVPTDLEAEVAFEFVSPTDNVQDTWDKCVEFIQSGRARLAVGICDREDQKEVFLAYRNNQGHVDSQVRQDPRFVDLGRVLPGFRIYLSYMMPGVISHFTRHHPLSLGEMDEDMLRAQLCAQIVQGGSSELAMEIVNGLHSVNFVDSAGRTPLVLAASTNNKDMLDYLLANGADTGYCDGDNVSALLLAKVNGPPHIYDALRTKTGADFHASIADLLDAMEQEARFGLLLEVLAIDGIDINTSEQVQGYTPLSHAVSTGRWAWAAAKLIDKGACPTMADSHGTIPLMKAMATMTSTQLKASKILDATNMDLQVARLALPFAEIFGQSEAAAILRAK